MLSSEKQRPTQLGRSPHEIKSHCTAAVSTKHRPKLTKTKDDYFSLAFRSTCVAYSNGEYHCIPRRLLRPGVPRGKEERLFGHERLLGHWEDGCQRRRCGTSSRRELSICSTACRHEELRCVNHKNLPDFHEKWRIRTASSSSIHLDHQRASKPYQWPTIDQKLPMNSTKS